MTNELEPCPFCGGEAMLCENLDYSYVYCMRCGCQTNEVGDILDAIEAWNTRYKRTCKPHIVARTFRGDSKPSFWQALCDCGWIVGEDGTPNLNEFTHVDNFCGGCGAEVIVDD